MKTLFIVFSLFIGSIAGAEELSLHKAQELLFQNNLDIVSNKIDLQKSVAELKEAQSQWYPSVDFSFGFNYLTEKTEIKLPTSPMAFEVGQNDKTELGLDISYPLFTGLSRVYNYENKKLNVSIKDQSITTTKNRMTFLLAILYLRWDFSFKQQEVLRKQIFYLQEYAAKSRVLAGGGIVAPVTVLESESRLKSAQVELLESIELTDSLTRELCGLIMTRNLKIIPQTNFSEIDSINLPTIVDSLRTEIQVMNKTIDQVYMTKKIISAQKFPTLGAVFGYRLSNPGLNMGTDEFMDYFLLGLQLKWNIFDGFRKRAQTDQLGTQIELLVNEKQKLFDKWDRALAASKSEYQRAVEKAGAADLSKKAAEELVRSLSESLKGGIITSVDYLNAVNALSLAELKYEQVNLQRRVATINALYASGREIIF